MTFCAHDVSTLVPCAACHTSALERIQKLEEVLKESNTLLRELAMALSSPFPGEDLAIAQLRTGQSLIEKSIMRRLLNNKLLSEKT